MVKPKKTKMQNIYHTKNISIFKFLELILGQIQKPFTVFQNTEKFINEYYCPN